MTIEQRQLEDQQLKEVKRKRRFFYLLRKAKPEMLKIKTENLQN